MMQHFPFIHYFNMKSELNELFASISMREFARSLINIFVPVYLWELGYGISTISLFFMIQMLSHAIVAFPAAKLSARFGFKHVILMSAPFLAVYYLLLNMLEQVVSAGIPMLLIPIFGGLSSGLFYVGFHSDFAETVSRKKTGKEFGYMKLLSSFFHAIGPAIGAFLLVELSFPLVFLIVCGVIILSVLPLFKRKDKHEPFSFKFDNLWDVLGFGATLAHLGKGMEEAVNRIIWPLFIFLFVFDDSITLLGNITSLALVFSMLKIYIISRHIDKRPNLFYNMGIFFTSLVWMTRFFIKTTLGVFFVDTTAGVSRTVQNISFNKRCYDHAKKVHTLKYITIREFVINFGFGVTFFILSFIKDYYVMFGFGLLGTLLYLGYRKG